MTPSETDEVHVQDGERIPPRRAGRDVLKIGRGDDRRTGGRGAEYARNLDDERRDDEDGDRKPDEAEKERKGQDGEKGQGAEKEGKKDEEAQARRKSRRPRVIAIMVIASVLLIGFFVCYYLSHKGKAETDDAWTDGNVVAVAPRVSSTMAVVATCEVDRAWRQHPNPTPP